MRYRLYCHKALPLKYWSSVTVCVRCQTVELNNFLDDEVLISYQTGSIRAGVTSLSLSLSPSFHNVPPVQEVVDRHECSKLS